MPAGSAVYIKPANLKVERREYRMLANQNGKRQAVIIIHEHGGDSVPAVFRSLSAALGFVKARVAKAPCFTPMLHPRGMIFTPTLR